MLDCIILSMEYSVVDESDADNYQLFIESREGFWIV